MFTEEQAIAMLKEKSDELGRLPKKDDFEGADISRIKSRLGPWTRALEKAGLKEPTTPPKRKMNPNRAKSRKRKEDALKKLQKQRNKNLK